MVAHEASGQPELGVDRHGTRWFAQLRSSPGLSTGRSRLEGGARWSQVRVAILARPLDRAQPAGRRCSVVSSPGCDPRPASRPGAAVPGVDPGGTAAVAILARPL